MFLFEICFCSLDAPVLDLAHCRHRRKTHTHDTHYLNSGVNEHEPLLYTAITPNLSPPLSSLLASALFFFSEHPIECPFLNTAQMAQIDASWFSVAPFFVCVFQTSCCNNVQIWKKALICKKLQKHTMNTSITEDLKVLKELWCKKTVASFLHASWTQNFTFKSWYLCARPTLEHTPATQLK